MKKFITFLFAALSITTAWAQDRILVGDMNNDGQLSVGDVSTLTNTILGRQSVRRISTTGDIYKSYTGDISGVWANNHSTMILQPDGNTDYESCSSYEYFPSQSLLLFYSHKEATKCFLVVEKTNKTLVLADPSLTQFYTYGNAEFYDDDKIPMLGRFLYNVSEIDVNTYSFEEAWKSSAVMIDMLAENPIVSVIINNPPDDSDLKTYIAFPNVLEIDQIQVSQNDVQYNLYQNMWKYVKNVMIGSIEYKVYCHDAYRAPRYFKFFLRNTAYSNDYYAHSLTLSDNVLSLNTGQTHQLNVKPMPLNAIIPSIRWESSNSAIATVSADGLVTAVKGGYCTITARATDGSGWSETCTLTIKQMVESIALSNTSLTLGLNEAFRLTATVFPSDAEDPSFTWTSSDESIAEVSHSGLVYTNGYGTAIITASANDGSGKKAMCKINVEKPHEFVDLGLPSGTLWATCNVGASKPEDYGDYFAWGETQPKSTDYDWSTYFDSVNSSSSNFKKYYNNGGKTELDFEDDAAYVNWGADWRMPSRVQMSELRNNCTWIWDSAKKGYNVVGPNNNFLFLPTAGLFSSSLYAAGSWGHYWSRSLYTNNSDSAILLSFTSDNTYCSVYVGWRAEGHSVRPVRVSTTK